MKGRLRYGSVTIPYSITQTKRKKTMQIFIEKDNVDVIAPLSKEISEIKQILKNKTRWIYLSQLKLKKRKTDVTVTKNSVLYLGENIPYVIKTMQKTDKIDFSKKTFEFNVKSKSLSKKDIEKLFHGWLIIKYNSYIKRKVKQYSKMLDVQPKEFQIKNLKTKWGSASISGNIHLNIHLLKTPKKMIDYVILHELTHLRIKGHGYEFWAFLAKFMPDYEKRKLWLDENYVEILKN